MDKQKEIPVGVVGAGTMGAGIALVALTAGYKVTICDVQPEVLERALSGIRRSLNRSVEKGRLTPEDMEISLARLQISTDLSVLTDAGLVVEAVPENLALKRKVLQQLEGVCQEDTILATNTSSLSITVLASGLVHRHRVVGLHFFNPAPVMRLIEVVVGEDTAPSVVERVTEFARTVGKETIACRDTPGFVVNRVARNFYGEALKIVGEGGVDYTLVDRLLEQAAGFRMGPFALMDLIGIDVNFDVTNSVYDAYHQEPRFRPHRLQEQKVLSGHLGKKSGRGFYRYDEEVGKAVEVKTAPHPFSGVSLRTADTGVTGDPTSGSTSGPSSTSGVVGHANEPHLPPVVIGDTPLAQALSVLIESRFDSPDRSLLFDGPINPAYPDIALQRLAAVRSHLQGVRVSTVIVSVAGHSMFHTLLLQTIEECVPDDAIILASLHGPSASTQASWLKKPERLRGFSAILSKGSQALPLAPNWAVSRRGEHQQPFVRSMNAIRSEYGLGAVVEWSRPVQAEIESVRQFESQSESECESECESEFESQSQSQSKSKSELAREFKSEPELDFEFASQDVDSTVRGLWASLGLEEVLIRDGIGGVAMRVLSMVLNEAEEVRYEGTASAADIDLAMRLGTNYPSGPHDWLTALGASTIGYTLRTLWTQTGDSRYRASQGLVQRLLRENSRNT